MATSDNAPGQGGGVHLRRKVESPQPAPAQQQPLEDPAQLVQETLQPPRRGFGTWWLWVLGALCVGVAVWLLVPGEDSTPGQDRITQTQTVTPRQAEVQQEVAEDIAPAQPESPGEGQQAQEPQPATPAAPVGPTVSTPTANPTATPQPQTTPTAPASREVHQEALRVIHGDYGNGDVRRQRLGDRYRAVQDHVNALHAQGVF